MSIHLGEVLPGAGVAALTLIAVRIQRLLHPATRIEMLEGLLPVCRPSYGGNEAMQDGQPHQQHHHPSAKD